MKKKNRGHVRGFYVAWWELLVPTIDFPIFTIYEG